MNIRIRQAVKSDLSHILEIYAQPDMDDGDVLEIPEAEAVFDRMEMYPDYRFYVAESDGAIVGTFALAIMDNLAHRGAPSGLIEDVAVVTGYQGKGIGKRMMRYALDICREKGCYKAALSSNMKRTKAHRFYEGLGFERHGYSFTITPG